MWEVELEYILYRERDIFYFGNYFFVMLSILYFEFRFFFSFEYEFYNWKLNLVNIYFGEN